MRILWDGNIHEIKDFFISESKEEISVEWVGNDDDPTKDGSFSLSIEKDCFKNGAKDFPAFIERVRHDLLKKGFFDFDQDYSKLIKKKRGGT